MEELFGNLSFDKFYSQEIINYSSTNCEYTTHKSYSFCFLFDPKGLPGETVMEWLYLIILSTTTIFFVYGAYKVYKHNRQVSFDSLILITGAVMNIMLLFSKFIICSAFFDLFVGNILTGSLLYMAYQIAVQLSQHLRNTLKYIIIPIVTIVTINIIVQTALAISEMIKYGVVESYHWFVVQGSFLILSITLFILYWKLQKIMNMRKTQLDQQYGQDVSDSSFINMRMRQLKTIAYSYMVMNTAFSLLVLFQYIFRDQTTNDFQTCYDACSIPLTQLGVFYQSSQMFIQASYTQVLLFAFWLIPRQHVKIVSKTQGLTNLEDISLLEDDHGFEEEAQRISTKASYNQETQFTRQTGNNNNMQTQRPHNSIQIEERSNEDEQNLFVENKPNYQIKNPQNSRYSM